MISLQIVKQFSKNVGIRYIAGFSVETTSSKSYSKPYSKRHIAYYVDLKAKPSILPGEYVDNSVTKQIKPIAIFQNLIVTNLYFTTYDTMYKSFYYYVYRTQKT